MKMERFKFSNFRYFERPVRVEGLIYATPEALYQSRKTLDHAERKRIAEARLPNEAKWFGRRVTLRQDWNDIKIEVMKWVQTLRFEQPKAKLELMSYVGELVEYNWWHDNFWGYCVCEKCKSKAKHNHLGNIIYDIRLKEN